MSSLDHLLDHLVDAQPQLLDEAPLEQPVDEPRVAREVLFHQVIERHVAGQTAGADDLQPVGVHANLDAPPGDAVVAVGHGVDERFAYSAAGVLQHLLTLQPVDRRPDAHLVKNDRPGTLDNPRQRAVQLGAAAVAHAAVLAARLGAGELDKDDAALGQERLRIAAEQQHADERRVAFAVGRADFDHQLGHRRGAAAGARLAPAQVFAQRVGVQIVGARPGYSFRFEVDRRSGHGQGANLLAAKGPVLVALAHQDAAVGQAM